MRCCEEGWGVDTKRKLAVWGTGNISTLFMQSNVDISPEIFLDNDEEKQGHFFHEIKIFHPSEMKNWRDFYIIVALDGYSSVKKQLKQFGLIEKEDYLWYRDWKFETNIDTLVNEAEEFLQYIEYRKKDNQRQRLLFSDFLAFDKGVCQFVNQWNQKIQDILLLSEAGWISDALARKKMQCPVWKLPLVLAHNQYIKVSFDHVVLEDASVYVKQHEYLRYAAWNLRHAYPDMASGYEYMICYYADTITRKIIDVWKPIEVILWNSFYAFHHIVRTICKEKSIAVQYMEFGNISNIIVVEKMGQMGESWPARFPEKFMQIPVSAKDCQDAEDEISRLRRNRINRNVQPKNNRLKEIKKLFDATRPIMVYFGQNDYASGLQPYTEDTKIFHSPVFRSSDEAANFLGELCAKNQWNYIYKPHPMMVQDETFSILSLNTIYVEDVDINDLIDLADVVVTILSTVSYIALIRQKPVVMLGYTQLKEKGCTYEAFRKEIIEKKVIEALHGEKKMEMKNAFVAHVAQMKKYYSSGISL